MTEINPFEQWRQDKVVNPFEQWRQDKVVQPSELKVLTFV
jgi:hypothetical protein